MIAYLSGKLKWIEQDHMIVDVQGVGYEVFCSSGTLGFFQGDVRGNSHEGQQKTIECWIYTAVREDAITLYGFQSPEEKQLFLSLLKVTGVGPKLALNVLSGAQPETIISMIDQGDVSALTKLPKVGKKTAEQMILTLKGKLVFAPDTVKNKKTVLMPAGNRQQIYSALVHLGFRIQDVEHVVADMAADLDIETGVREGLAALTSL